MYPTLCRSVLGGHLIEPNIPFALGTSVVSAKSAFDNVAEEHFVLLLLLSSLLPRGGLKVSIQHLHPTRGGGECGGGVRSKNSQTTPVTTSTTPNTPTTGHR